MPMAGSHAIWCQITGNHCSFITLLILEHILNTYTDCVFSDCDQNGPLGMITGDIQDWQITASSTYPQEWDKGCHERHGRVYQPNGLGWCAKYKSSSEWLQVDLGVAAKVRISTVI